LHSGGYETAYVVEGKDGLDKASPGRLDRIVIDFNGPPEHSLPADYA
jgi:hypothetical protein